MPGALLKIYTRSRCLATHWKWVSSCESALKRRKRFSKGHLVVLAMYSDVTTSANHDSTVECVPVIVLFEMRSSMKFAGY